MDFNTYQSAARNTAVYPGKDEGQWMYPALGLAGETGEICEKLKKALRDEQGVISPERKAALRKELGDVLWYIAALCSELGLAMDDVASFNIEKLARRSANNRLHGDGDDR